MPDRCADAEERDVRRVVDPDGDGHAVERGRIGVAERDVALEARLGHREGIHLGLLVADDAALFGHTRKSRRHGDREDRHEQDDQRERHAAAVAGEPAISHAGS